MVVAPPIRMDVSQTKHVVRSWAWPTCGGVGCSVEYVIGDALCKRFHPAVKSGCTKEITIIQRRQRNAAAWSVIVLCLTLSDLNDVEWNDVFFFISIRAILFVRCSRNYTPYVFQACDCYVVPTSPG